MPMETTWSATHKVSFIPAGSGTSQTWFVMRVADAAADGTRSAFTHGEWLSHTAAAWTESASGAWRWRGLATPRGESGTVEVAELTGAAKRLLGLENDRERPDPAT
jgi:hypothetical protein